MKKSLKTGVKKAAGALLAVMTAAGLLSSCSLLPEEETFAEAPLVLEYEGAVYRTAKVKREDVYLYDTLAVNYVPLQSRDLAFDVSGLKYGEFMVSVGDSVKKGDVLAELDLEDLNARIESYKESQASLELSLRQNEEKRDIRLRETKERMSSASEEDLKEALASVNEQFDKAAKGYEDSLYITKLRIEALSGTVLERQILAPFDGTVTYVYSPDSTSAELSDKTKTVIKVADAAQSVFRGKTTYWDCLDEEDSYTIVVNNEEYAAHLTSEEELGIPETSHEEGKGGYVYFTLDEPAFTLSDNASGRVRVMLDSRSQVLAVPNSAVSFVNGKSILYYPKETGIRYYREVETGLVGSGYTEILSGVEEGEEVIIQ